jgi:hypothetical protein
MFELFPHQLAEAALVKVARKFLERARAKELTLEIMPDDTVRITVSKYDEELPKWSTKR